MGNQHTPRNLNEYRAPVPAFSALQQLEIAGKRLRLGQSIRLIYTLGIPRARAWDAPTAFDTRRVNIPRYRRLLDRAIDTVIEPITGADKSWITQTKQLAFDFVSPSTTLTLSPAGVNPYSCYTNFTTQTSTADSCLTNSTVCTLTFRV